MRETTREKAPIFYMVVVLFATLMPYAFQSMNAIADIHQGRGNLRKVASVSESESWHTNGRFYNSESLRASR